MNIFITKNSTIRFDNNTYDDDDVDHENDDLMTFKHEKIEIFFNFCCTKFFFSCYTFV